MDAQKEVEELRKIIELSSGDQLDKLFDERGYPLPSRNHKM